METIPFEVEQKIHQVLSKKLDIKSFESWVYTYTSLESTNPRLYLELISFDYDSGFKNFYDCFARYVSFYKFEAGILKEYLYSIINRDFKCADSIFKMYRLYCRNYNFFQKLGIIYGLELIDYDTSVPNIALDSILNKIYPNIIKDAKNALNWFEEGKIIFIDKNNGYGGFEYKDLRSEAEIQQGKA